MVISSSFLKLVVWYSSGIPYVGCSFFILFFYSDHPVITGVRCSSVVRAFAHGVMGHRINPSW